MHRADDRLAAAVVADGLAHRLDPGGQRRLADEAVAPDLVEQLLLAHDLAAPLHEVAQEVEDLRLDPNLVAVAAQHDAGEVQLAVREPKDQPLHLSQRQVTVCQIASIALPSSAPGRIRTSDLGIRSPSLSSAELRGRATGRA